MKEVTTTKQDIEYVIMAAYANVCGYSSINHRGVQDRKKLGLIDIYAPRAYGHPEDLSDAVLYCIKGTPHKMYGYVLKVQNLDGEIYEVCCRAGKRFVRLVRVEGHVVGHSVLKRMPVHA